MLALCGNISLQFSPVSDSISADFLALLVLVDFADPKVKTESGSTTIFWQNIVNQVLTVLF